MFCAIMNVFIGNKGIFNKGVSHTKKTRWQGILAILLVVILLGTILYCSKAKNRKDSTATDQEQPPVEEQEPKEAITFPYTLEDGELEIEALFQYSGMNPDCNDEEGENVGAIQLKNCSEQYLKNTKITMEMEDGTTLQFLIEDLPADSTVLAFEVSNTPYDDTKAVWEINSESAYQEASLQEEDITVTEEGSSLVVKNKTDTTIPHLTVVYRCVMDDMYFGGKSYSKEISSLEGGKTTEVDTSECYFGEAAVVNIEKD